MVNGIFTFKESWFLFFTGLLIILYSLETINKDFCLNLNRLDVMVLLFLVYAILTTAFHNRDLLSRKNMENLGLLLTYFLSKRIFMDRKFHVNTFNTSILGLVMVQIAIAFLQLNNTLTSFNSNFLITGFFNNSGPYAIYLSALLVYCLATFLYCPSKIIKFISLSQFVIGVPIVIFTLSRAAWLGLFAGIIVIVESKYNIVYKLGIYIKSKTYKGVLLVCLTSIIAYSLYFLYHFKKDSADGRLLVWKVSNKIFQDHFLSGIGAGHFPATFLNYQSQYFRYHPNLIPTEGRLAGEVWYAFNHILQIGIEQGIIGIVLFTTLLIIVFKYCKILLSRSTSNQILSLGLGASASAIVIFVSSLFSYSLSVLPILILFFYSLSIISANYEILKKSIDTDQNKIIIKKNIVLTTIIFLFGIYFINHSKNVLNAYKHWHMIESRGYENNDIEKLSRFRFILDQDADFLIKRAEYLLDLGRYYEGIELLEHAKNTCSNPQLYFLLGNAYENLNLFKKAEKQYIFLSSAIPNLLQPKFLLAMLYYKQGHIMEWKKLALEVINFKPKVQSPITEAMMRETQTLYFKSLVPTTVNPHTR